MVSTVRRHPSLQLLLIFGALASVFVIYQQAVQAAVTEKPRRDIPIVLDGEVWATEQVGSAIVVGGNFTQVQTERNGPIVDQVGIFAYDMNSGEFLADFTPIFVSTAGQVEIRDLISSPDGKSVYVGGRFSTIDDRTDGTARVRTRLAKLNIEGGTLDRNFAQAGVDAQPLSMALLGSELYVGGNFTVAFDIAPGRSPIPLPVAGLARFDSTTGVVDSTFRYDSADPIGRALGSDATGQEIRNAGVARVALTPNNQNLVVAHRGAAFVDQTRGQTFDAPGVAVIALGADQGTHSVSGFKALHPDPAEPIQAFYHAAQCGDSQDRSRGVQIRDMAVSNDAIFLTHQGADSGIQCDTIVRFPITNGGARPAWIHRAFDSVFSVELVGNDLYIGGHFRYLVNSSAPSPYPGQQPANVGGTTVDGQKIAQVYEADPTGTRDGHIRFRDDLANPGYVFPVGQIGLLNATTGFADPDFTPTSDALLGVLEITAIERGLIVGQDQSRLNNINVGRHFFLDIDPKAAVEVPPVIVTDCSVTLNGDSQSEVSWTDNDFSRVAVVRDGRWVANVEDGASFTQQLSPGDYSYDIRAFNGSERTDATCGSVTVVDNTPPPAALACTAAVSGGEVTVSWTDNGFSRVAVVRDGRWVANVEDGASFTQQLSRGDYTYDIRAFASGERTDVTCGTASVGAGVIPVAPGGFTCTAVANGDNVTLTWTDVGANSYQARSRTSWLAQLDGADTTITLPAADGPFVIRYRLAGVSYDTNCV